MTTLAMSVAPVDMGLFAHADIAESDSLSALLMSHETLMVTKQPTAAELDAFFAPTSGNAMETDSWSSSDEVRAPHCFSPLRLTIFMQSLNSDQIHSSPYGLETAQSGSDEEGAELCAPIGMASSGHASLFDLQLGSRQSAFANSAFPAALPIGPGSAGPVEPGVSALLAQPITKRIHRMKKRKTDRGSAGDSSNADSPSSSPLPPHGSPASTPLSFQELPADELLNLTSDEFEQYVQNLGAVRLITAAEDKELRKLRRLTLPCIVDLQADSLLLRLIKNREYAQSSRNKKKQHVEEVEVRLQAMAAEKAGLEERLAAMQAENLALRTQLGKIGVAVRADAELLARVKAALARLEQEAHALAADAYTSATSLFFGADSSASVSSTSSSSPSFAASSQTFTESAPAVGAGTKRKRAPAGRASAGPLTAVMFVVLVALGVFLPSSSLFEASSSPSSGVASVSFTHRDLLLKDCHAVPHELSMLERLSYNYLPDAVSDTLARYWFTPPPDSSRACTRENSAAGTCSPTARS